jgi:hypothetical protein
MRRRVFLIPITVMALLGAAAQPANAEPTATGALVSVGSPATITPPNHQNEPAVAVDANHPNVLVAGSNDYVDQPVCPEDFVASDGSCDAFATGAGLSGVYFSFDAGRTWIQPTYTGWTGRNCPPVSTCTGEFGPIRTLPWYYENGLVSDGDPAVAVGPKPGPNGFSWANGSRVYYANLTSAFRPAFPNPTFHGFEALAVSRLDDPTPARVLQKSSWQPPVIVDTRSSQTAFEDKEQIWADNAASSPYFGRVYMCAPQFRSASGHPNANAPAPLEVAVSPDGGSTWRTKQLTPAATGGHGPTLFGLSGCTIRTTSTGTAYLFAQMFENPALVGLPTHSFHVVFTSTDGGASWSKMSTLFRTTDPCSFVDPIYGRCVMDGYAGARTDLSAAPSVDIANGAPTGAGATNTIIDAWVDGTLNAEKVVVAYNRGGTWSTPAAVSLAGDRPIYTAPAISPVGDRAYVMYEAVTSPWRGADMTSPRPYHGVFLTSAVPASGAGTWTAAYVGPTGDIRASYPGHDIYQERIGDYVYAAATRAYGVGVYIDASRAAVCNAVQAYRAASLAAGARALPAPYPPDDCPATFGNTDVVAATTG